MLCEKEYSINLLSILAALRPDYFKGEQKINLNDEDYFKFILKVFVKSLNLI